MISGPFVKLAGLLALIVALLATPAAAQTPAASPAVTPIAGTADLDITDARVRHLADLDLLVFEIDVAGTAGATVPDPRGQMDGAPVLAYVFPTSLAPEAVGFAPSDGVLALVVTSHPDFDDTPLWDESRDGAYDNDGIVYHTHWVVLVPDDRAPGNLAVKEVVDADPVAVLPPTGPGMPLYLDSPGFDVLLDEQTLRVIVPASRIAAEPDFTYDAATAYLEVNMSDPNRPVLGVYEIYSLLSGDLSLPYEIVEE
jgi:hypothetical protein